MHFSVIPWSRVKGERVGEWLEKSDAVVDMKLKQIARVVADFRETKLQSLFQQLAWEEEQWICSRIELMELRFVY